MTVPRKLVACGHDAASCAPKVPRPKFWHCRRAAMHMTRHRAMARGKRCPTDLLKTINKHVLLYDSGYSARLVFPQRTCTNKYGAPHTVATTRLCGAPCRLVPSRRSGTTARCSPPRLHNYRELRRKGVAGTDSPRGYGNRPGCCRKRRCLHLIAIAVPQVRLLCVKTFLG